MLQSDLDVLVNRAEFHWHIEGFTVADVILVVGQTRQNLQWMCGENRDFDAHNSRKFDILQFLWITN